MRSALRKFLTCFISVLVACAVIFPVAASALDEKTANPSLSQRIRCFFIPRLVFWKASDACDAYRADDIGNANGARDIAAVLPAQRQLAGVSAPSNVVQGKGKAPVLSAPSSSAQKPKSSSPTSQPGITRSELDAALRGIRAEILRAIPAGTASYAASAPASYYGGGYSVPAPNTASTDYVSQQTAAVPQPWTSNGSALYYSGGNVGIGTVNPSTVLDVTGRTRLTGVASAIISGTADPDGSKVLNGAGTRFATDLVVGDRITVNGESRSITSISSDTSLTVDTAFTDTSAASVTRQAFVFQSRLSDNTPAITLNDAGNLVIGNLPEVGTVVPQSKLYVVSDTGSSYTAVFESDSDSVNGAYLSLRHARGTPTAPTAAQNGDSNFIYGGFYDGGRFWNGGQISFVLDGTVVAGSRPPTSLTFSTNNGININERMRISPTGNVGIGTTTPSTKLHILSTTEQLRLGYDAANYLSNTINSTGDVTYNAVGSGGSFAFSRNGTNRLTINSAGNVGIGTTTPGQVLAVAGTSLFTGNSSFLGSVTSAGAVLVSDGTASAPALAFSSQTALGIYKSASNVLSITGASNSPILSVDTFANQVNMTTAPNTPYDYSLKLTGGNDPRMIIGGSGNTGTGAIFLGGGRSAIIGVAEGAWLRQDMYFALGSDTNQGNKASTTDAKMVIKALTGNVGIGTVSPSDILTVRKDSAGAVTTGLRLENLGVNTTNTGSAIDFYQNKNNGSEVSTKMSSISNLMNNPGANPNADIVFSSINNGTFAEKFRILASGGFTTGLGLGLTSLASGVSASETLNFGLGSGQTAVITGGNNASTLRLSAGVASLDQTANIALSATSLTNQADTFIWKATSLNSSTELMRLTTAGNVGIGTSTPSTKLDIFHTENFTSAQLKKVLNLTSEDNAGGTFFGGSGVGLSFDVRSASQGSANVGAIYGLLGAQNNSLTSGDLAFHTLTSSVLSEKLRITSAGNVGIGTTTPGQVLTVAGSAQFTGVLSGTKAFDLNLTAEGVLTTSASDARLKEDLEAMDASSTLGKIMDLRPYRFSWISDPSHARDVGLIAQDVERVFPEIAFTNPVDGYKGVNYSKLPAILVAGMQEIARRVEGFAEKVSTKLVEAKDGLFGKVKTNELCVGETCITETELKQFLESRNPQSIPVAPTASPLPSAPAPVPPAPANTDSAAVTDSDLTDGKKTQDASDTQDSSSASTQADQGSGKADTPSPAPQGVEEIPPPSPAPAPAPAPEPVAHASVSGPAASDAL